MIHVYAYVCVCVCVCTQGKDVQARKVVHQVQSIGERACDSGCGKVAVLAPRPSVRQSGDGSEKGAHKVGYMKVGRAVIQVSGAKDQRADHQCDECIARQA